MKKVFAAILAAAMVTSLTACGGGSAPAASAAPAAGGTSSAAPAAAPAAGAITLKVAHVEAEDRSTHKALLEFKADIEAKSNGHFVVEIYPNAVLGGDVQLAEATALGTIQISLPSTSVLTMYNEKFGVLDMPFLFNSAEKAFAALDGELGQTLSDYMDGVGAVNLGYTYNGPRCMTNSKKPINTPEDLKGMKMRVMESPVFITMFETLGANATPMSFNELFTGLQQKTVDAQENPPSLIYASRFQEVQSNLSLTNHVHNFLAVLVNEKFLTGLSAEDQTLLKDCIKTFADRQRAMELEDNGIYIEKLKEAGMQVNEITPENQAKFQAALQPMYTQYEATFGKELFDLAKKYNG